MSVKSSLFQRRPLLWACLSASVLLLLSLVGCYPLTSEGKVVGTYELATEQGKIVLDIRRDHTFIEKIMFRNLPPEERRGKWKWTTGLDLDSLWIPSQFCPDYIVQADPGRDRMKLGIVIQAIGPSVRNGNSAMSFFQSFPIRSLRSEEPKLSEVPASSAEERLHH